MSGIWDKLVIQCLLVVYREYRTRDLIFHNYYVPDKMTFRNTDDYSQYVSDNDNLYLNEIPFLLDREDTDPIVLPNGSRLSCLL